MEFLKEIFIQKIGLTESHFETFISISQSKILQKKENFTNEGNVCSIVAFISSGLLRSFIQRDGEEFNTDFYFENQFVSAYSSFVTQLPSAHSIQALTKTSFYYITFDQLNALVSTDNEWLKFGKYIAEFFLIRKCSREMSFLKQTAGERMAEMLASYPGIEQLVSQYHIASYLGIKPESLSRIKLANYALKAPAQANFGQSDMSYL